MFLRASAPILYPTIFADKRVSHALGEPSIFADAHQASSLLQARWAGVVVNSVVYPARRGRNPHREENEHAATPTKASAQETEAAATFIEITTPSAENQG